MNKLLLPTLLATLVPLAALAAVEDAPASAPTVFEIDPVHSSVTFRLRHMGTAWSVGRFNTLSGTLAYDAEDVSKCRVDAVVDPASVDTNNGDRDKHLRSADFFDVEKHSAMTFASKSVERVDEDTLRMTGALVYRGVEQPMTIEFDLVGESVNPRTQRRVVGFSAEFDVDRTLFGDSYGVANRALGSTVSVRVDIEATEKR